MDMLVSRWAKRVFLTWIWAGLIVVPTIVHAERAVMPDMKEKALSDLHQLLYTEKEWIKVHVAEFLIWEDEYVDEVRNAFLEEERQFGDIPKYRIGIWRVLAQAARTNQERKIWVDKIVSAYANDTGPDRLHAIETLAKLKSPVHPGEQLMGSITDPFAVYRLWNAAYHPSIGVDSVRTILISLLVKEGSDECAEAIRVISYVLRNFMPFEVEDWRKIKMVAMEFNGPPEIAANLLATAWITAAHPMVDEVQSVKDRLIKLAGAESNRLQLFNAIAIKGGADDRAMLAGLYGDIANRERKGYDPDVHAMAAYAILKI